MIGNFHWIGQNGWTRFGSVLLLCEEALCVIEQRLTFVGQDLVNNGIEQQIKQSPYLSAGRNAEVEQVTPGDGEILQCQTGALAAEGIEQGLGAAEDGGTDCIGSHRQLGAMRREEVI